RAAARQVLLGYAVPRAERGLARRRREVLVPDDGPIEARLTQHHAALNAERFGNTLGVVPVRVSRRLRSRLGYYRLAAAGTDPEIVISRRHLRRHGWDEAVATLLHEMVHQWQDESGLPVDHGPGFRAKARAVGVTPAARRVVR
ncbi:MAG TPA: SprT-like domain-containing protein, partial [Gemmatimonadaceae bacterium]|nr:SprT-like domain-containing protein [Gemmatimonadaceae bacterium]